MATKGLKERGTLEADRRWNGGENLARLEAERNRKRQQMERLFEQLQQVRKQMNELQEELHVLDDEIETATADEERGELGAIPEPKSASGDLRDDPETSAVSDDGRSGGLIVTEDDDTDEKENNHSIKRRRKFCGPLTIADDCNEEVLTDPLTAPEHSTARESVEDVPLHGSIPRDSRPTPVDKDHGPLSFDDQPHHNPTNAQSNHFDYGTSDHDINNDDIDQHYQLQEPPTEPPEPGEDDDDFMEEPPDTRGIKCAPQTSIGENWIGRYPGAASFSTSLSFSDGGQLRRSYSLPTTTSFSASIQSRPELSTTNGTRKKRQSLLFPPKSNSDDVPCNLRRLDQLDSSTSQRRPPKHGSSCRNLLDLTSGSLRASHAKRPPKEDRNATYMKRLQEDTFPWSQQVTEQLRDTFRIQSFRDHQKEIINCTMSGDDVFVIMRTGGGKSLTYQLPALIEGRGSDKKVTFVVSPLISLIRDQEDQMNALAEGSAISFTSGMPGGSAEHARRWALVRDPEAGVVLVFVTPEKIDKSNKLRSELEKLHERGRLGRFVIDECHCACQWGHDFRPDYTKLGILKAHFPTVPIMAVTATASDRVRDDCCRILRLGTNYQFFRSSANRPNLRYEVREKMEGKDTVVEDMADFIRLHHDGHAGIIYTFSRNEADAVADKLCESGIVARSYHSSINETTKDAIHRSWMRNETQVVVATIAFGLGINKPDVRFVLHHSLSKSLESYYQESGRAGRDGQHADCVLYYSPKDVARMLCMIHGESGENTFWSMVRYAQAAGDDNMCRALLLSVLGETEGNETFASILQQGCGETMEYDVGVHAKNVLELVQHAMCYERDELTPTQIVTRWRSKKEALDCIKANPPNKDLTKSECDRIVTDLMLQNYLQPKVIFNAYGSNMYAKLGPQAPMILSSHNPSYKIRFPKRVQATPKKRKSQPAAVAGDDGWINTRTKSDTKQRKDSAAVSKTTKAKGGQRSGGRPSKRRVGGRAKKGSRVASSGKRNKSSVSILSCPVAGNDNVIELDLSSGEESEVQPVLAEKARTRRAKGAALSRMKETALEAYEDSDNDSF